MQRVTLQLEITLCSPFLFPAADAAGMGVDALPMRDRLGRPVIPADQIRGVLREALEDLADAAPNLLSRALLEPLLGTSTGDARAEGAGLGRRYAPSRARLAFTDLVGSADPPARQLASRIAIDATTGAVAEGALMVVELVAPVGTHVTFAGEVVLFATSADKPKIVKAMRAALGLVGAIGAQKAVGFGNVVGSPLLTESTVRELGPLPARARGLAEPVALRMTFDRPVLVDATAEAANLFKGSAVVPGGVVKGALARRLELAGAHRSTEVQALLSGMRVTHAFPEDLAGEVAGRALPLSLVMRRVGSGGYLIGDALCAAPPSDAPPDSFPGAMFGGAAARYATDWKPGWEEAARERLGLPGAPTLVPDLRVHTEIDRASGAARDQRLFVTVALQPWHANDRTGAADGLPVHWRLTLIPPARPAEGLWAGVVELLTSEGLDGIGRTGAQATFERLPAPVEFPRARAMDGTPGRFAVVLETAAVLFELRPGLTAREAYQAYWSDVLPGARLLDHVARQRLVGGYVALRHRPHPGRYVPFVLTEPGATFLLSGVTAGDLDGLMRSGLPVPLLGGKRVTWEECPFVPENGYGAFRADHLSTRMPLDEVTFV